jgi:DNA replication protein DnaC
MDVSQTSSSGLSKIDLSYICPDCSTLIAPLEIDFLAQKKWIRGTCTCRIRKMEEARQERILWERQRRIERYFRLSQLGPKFSKATFEAWEFCPGAQTAFKEATAFVKEAQWQKGEGLLFFGAPGTGKSHLAAAIVNAIIPMGALAIFQNVPELLLKFKDTFYSHATAHETGILNSIEEADLVVLDDLGAENLTVWALEKIYEVVNSLNYFEKSLIITTNLDIETGLEQRIGPRIYDRIIEMCKLVEVKGASFRRLKAERRMDALKPAEMNPKE